MYFVAEWMTMSAPSESGCWSTGVAKVLSTTSTAPAWPARPRRSCRDVEDLEHRVRGRLDPDHLRVSGRSAAARRRIVSCRRSSTSMPSGFITLSKRRKVPP
jgi:hypothetical protein